MNTRGLFLYDTYSRQDVHDIFSPDTRFAPSAGTWGLWGIVPIPSKPGDVVLFVTFGQQQAGHVVDEWISEDGIINWQSQPRQSLADRQIQQFIHHDPTKNDIHLFLRTKKSTPYTYFGKLAYHSHDPRHEKPVWIQWQILDWKISDSVFKNINLSLRSASINGERLPFYRQTSINEEKAPLSLVAETPMDYRPSHKPTGFRWQGKWYECSQENVKSMVQLFIQNGLPEEATRYIDWYIEINGVHVSPKWIFHLITKADYSEFITTTARNKLKQLEFIAQKAEPEPAPFQLSLEPGGENRQIKEQGMYKPKRYKTATIDSLTDLLNDLISIGEIPIDQLNAYWLPDYHYLDLLRSTFVLANPMALLASPRYINLFPLENAYELLSKLSLSRYWGEDWPNFSIKAFNLSINEKYSLLDHRYSLVPIPENIYEDIIPRPVFLYNYFSNQDDWEDWEIEELFKLRRVYTAPKLFIHSTLPIQNLYGGIVEIQQAVWKSALYWIMLQLIILSDPQTGTVYDPQISLFLSNGWKEDSVARLYLQDEYIGELVDCLDPFLTRFNWVWVNRSGNPVQDQKSILGILRLLLKINIAELGRDGRIQFVDEYRQQLFESKSKEQINYRNSKEARDQLREAIKELKK